jgi:Na+/melibiose symporter-like transporter
MLADKIGKEKVLTIGYAVFAVSSLLMVILTGNSMHMYWQLYLVFIWAFRKHCKEQ